jgi:hypothetical protein
MSKLVRVVRAEIVNGQKLEIARYFEIFPKCSPAYFYNVVQYVYGNYLSSLYIPVLLNSTGSRTSFYDLEDHKTYFLTFEKIESSGMVDDFTPDELVFIEEKLQKSEILNVIMPEEHIYNTVLSLKEEVKEKLAILYTRKEHNMNYLKNTYMKLRRKLGDHSMAVLEIRSIRSNLECQVSLVTPALTKLIESTSEVAQELKRVYQNKPQTAGNVPLPKVFSNYHLNSPSRLFKSLAVQKLKLDDLPLEEISQAELKRFVSFHSRMSSVDSNFGQMPSQNTPLNARAKQITVPKPDFIQPTRANVPIPSKAILRMQNRGSGASSVTISQSSFDKQKNPIKVMVHDDWSMDASYVKLAEDELKLSHVPSFSSFKSFGASSIRSVRKIGDKNEYLLEIIADDRRLVLEFGDMQSLEELKLGLESL